MVDPNVRKFTVIVEEDEEGFSGRCVELPAAISQGKTLEELKENMAEAILLVIDHMMSKVKNNKDKNLITLEVPVQ